MRVTDGISFRQIGPAVTGGRVTAVLGVAGSPTTFYVGAADGGIFRTRDDGLTWKALFQHESVASIGALALDPKNPEIIWAGTGEANVRNDISFGDGVYKSTDAGEHWTHVGLEHTFQISRIAVDPDSPKTILVAAMGSPWRDSADRGVYRSVDGGQSWRKVLYLGPSIGISDLAMDPKNPEIVFAATYRFRRTPWGYSGGGVEDGIYKSHDGGATWRRLNGHGLPSDPVSRIGLAIAASSPNVIYAVIGSKQGVLWRSDDYGDNWKLVSKDENVDARPFYFSRIEVDPTDANHLFALSIYLLESVDGGHTFHKVDRKIHVDNHAMWIDPNGSGRVIEGNDGGLLISPDNGRHWAFLDNLPIGQYYHIALGGGPRFEICGGLQDNAGWCGPSRSRDPKGILGRMWFAVNDDDGIYAIPAADNQNLIYNSTQNGVYMVFDRTTEQSRDIEPYPRDFTGIEAARMPYRFAWESAFAVSPANPRVLYVGANVVFKSEDRGRTWRVISPDLTRNDKDKQSSSGGPVIQDNSGAEVYDAILSITAAEGNPGVLWVGTDDGEVQVTQDGGATWTNVSSHIPHLPPWGRVESIDVSATNPGEALIAIDRHFSGDFKPYLFRTRDYGRHWTSITGNLPANVYAHVVRRDLRNPALYYAGLESGLYASWDAGKKWYPFELGLPSSSVYDLALDASDNDLVVATHGRSLWIMDDLTPFQRFGPQVARTPLTLFHPQDALRFWPHSDVQVQGDGVFYGQNPNYGAAFSYYLGHAIGDHGSLVIRDSAGSVVRTLKDVCHRAGEVGLHRFYWDLRADGPVRWDSARTPFVRGPRSGALVPPGTYTATLKLGGESASQTFNVVNDATSGAPIAAIEERYHVTEEVLGELSRLDMALNRIQAINAQLAALRSAAKAADAQGNVYEAIAALERSASAVRAAITSDAGAEEAMLRLPDRIHEHLLILDSVLEGEDGGPTAAMLQQKNILDDEYREAIGIYNNFVLNQIADFNRTMMKDGLTGIFSGVALSP